MSVRRLSWAAMGIVVVVALVLAIGDDAGPRTNAERAAELSRTIACPQCAGQSVAESNAPIAEIISAEIKERVDRGETDAQIRAAYVDQYGEWVNLKPAGTGFDAWVWVAPFLVIGAAAGGLGVGFARWREAHPAPASAADKEAVAKAMEPGARHERRMATRLDPDALARLEDERDFLLTSLQDLDAEREAGDISAEDHAVLEDDYTRRAAEVISGIEEERDAFLAAPRISGRQITAWVVGLALIGGLAGVAVARSSGTRLAGQTGSGEARESVITKLNQARELFADEGEWDTAVELYDEILTEQPSNVEALTYRSWLQYRQGVSVETVMTGWDAAVAIDPTYPDVRVFRTIASADAGDWAKARAELAAFDAAGPPSALQALVEQRGLRGEIVARTHLDELTAGDRLDLAELDITVLEALLAAEYLLTSDVPDASVAALKLYDAVLTIAPDEPEALLGTAFIYTEAGLDERAAEALARFDDLDSSTVPPPLVDFADQLRSRLGA